MPIKVNNVEITTNKINNNNVSEEKLNGTKVYPSIAYYTVRFYDFSGGSLLKTEQVQQGGNATAPANPARTGYTWLGWDKSYINVQSNLDVYGTWQINTYTVRFYDYQGGTLLSTQTVNHGASATAPTQPTRTGYQFTGWSPPYTNITTNTDIYGQWVLASTNYWAYIDEMSGFMDDPIFGNIIAYDYNNVITNATAAQAFLEHVFPARNQNLSALGLVYNQVIDYCWIFEVHS